MFLFSITLASRSIQPTSAGARSCKQQRTSSILYSFFFFLLHFSPAVTCLQPCGLALDAVMDNFAIPDEWGGGGRGRGDGHTRTRSRALRGFSGLIQISSHASDVGCSFFLSFFLFPFSLSFLLPLADRLLTRALGGTYQLSWSPHTGNKRNSNNGSGVKFPPAHQFLV